MPGQVDRFGRPIPADPGYREIINADGSVVQQRTTLYLDSSIVATDNPDSDATNLSAVAIAPPSSANTVETVDSVSALRTWANAPSYKTIYRTRQYGAYGARLGAWDYYWDEDSVEADDGVLVFAAGDFPTGRFKAIRPPDGMMSALACGPAAANLGTRTKSFDPLGVVGVVEEFRRVTTILAVAGFAGLRFPDGTYKIAGGEYICTRRRGQGFVIEGSAGTLFQGPAYNIDTSAQAINFCSRADGAQDANGNVPLFTNYPVDNVGNGTIERTFTQTFTGADRTMVGVKNIFGLGPCSALAVGDICYVKIGALRSDIGWWASWYYAEIESITPTTGTAGNVTFKQPLPEQPPPDAGINVNRTQVKHDMVKIQVDGFQDNLTFRNLTLDQVFFGGSNARSTTFENCNWRTSTFCFNLISCLNTKVTSTHIEKATGTDVTHLGDRYGGIFALQGCYNTHIESIKVDNLDGVFLIDEEFASRGTKIGLADITWTAKDNLVYGNVSLFIQNGGETNVVTCDHLILRGGYNNVSWADNVKVGYLEDRSFSTNANRHLPLHAVDRITTQGYGDAHERSYTNHRTYDYILPLSTTPSGAVYIDIPQHGLCRRMRLKTTNLANITTVYVGAAEIFGLGGWYDVKGIGLLTATDTWCDVSQAASVMNVGAPGFGGYRTIRIEVTSGGTPPPAGSYLSVMVNMFLRDPDRYPTPTGSGDLNETSKEPILCGSGAPTANADFIGQDYIDSNASPRKWYKSVNTGTGTSDWVALN